MRLWAFVVRRLLLLIPVLIGVSLFVFFLTGLTGARWTAYVTTEKVTPQEINGIIQKYHLDADPITQYFYWLDATIHGDWGYSKAAVEPVTQAIAQKFPATFELTLVSMVIGVSVGIKLGTVSAVRRDKVPDHLTRVFALAGVSIPVFVLALILIYVFFFELKTIGSPIYFPLGGRISSQYLISGYGVPVIPQYTGFYLVDSALSGYPPMFFDVVWHLVLPSLTLAIADIALITRIMRSSMLEVMNQDYVRTARSKGLSEKEVIRKHARRNALIPTTTVTGLAFGGLLTGAVLTETLFQWPGLGQWSTLAIETNDLAGIMGFTLVVAVVYVITNLIVDIVYAYLDPRVRLE